MGAETRASGADVGGERKKRRGELFFAVSLPLFLLRHIQYCLVFIIFENKANVLS